MIYSFLKVVLQSPQTHRGWKIPETTLVFPWRSVLTHTKTHRPDRLREWAHQLAQTHTHNKAAVALANKMARIVWAVWSRQQPYVQIQKAA